MNFSLRFLLFFSLTLSTFAKEESQSLKLVTGEFPPFSGEKIPEGGILTALAKAIFEECGYQTDIKFLPWARGYAGAQTGIFDATFPYGKNAQREADFNYSNVYYVAERRIYTREEETLSLEKIKSKKDLVYCSPVGFTVYTEIQSFIDSKHLKMTNPRDQESCLKMISLKRADFAILPTEVASLLIEKHQLKNIKASEQPFGKNENHVLVSKTHPKSKKIIQDFNQCLAKIQQNGKYQQILKRVPIKEDI